MSAQAVRIGSMLIRGYSALPVLGLCLLAIGVAGCASPDENGPGGEARTIDEVLASHNEELLAIEGVIGSGIFGKDEDSVIFVIVEHPDDETLGQIPQRLEGYPVITVDAGQIREMTGLDLP
jgi:hypothetical protein